MTSVAIIGHGRSPEGQGWAEKIDACTYVIRMWDWGWQDRADYGNKYDFGLLEAHPSYLQSWRIHNKHEPEIGWIASKVTDRSNSGCQLPNKTEVFDQLEWANYGMSIGGAGSTGRLRYTRGTLAALWAMERIEPDELILVGFDSIWLRYAQPTDEAFSEAYQHNPGTFSFNHYTKTVDIDGSTTKHGNHDYAVERTVLEFYAEKHQVKLLWAQELWGDAGSAAG